MGENDRSKTQPKLNRLNNLSVLTGIASRSELRLNCAIKNCEQVIELQESDQIYVFII